MWFKQISCVAPVSRPSGICITECVECAFGVGDLIKIFVENRFYTAIAEILESKRPATGGLYAIAAITLDQTD